MKFNKLVLIFRVDKIKLRIKYLYSPDLDSIKLKILFSPMLKAVIYMTFVQPGQALSRLDKLNFG